MKRYKFDNGNSIFTIIDYENGQFSIYGNRDLARVIFKEIHKMPPNKYGNFYGREKAGAKACKEIIEKYNLRGVEL